VVDPFCGWGTALAVANALGMPAIGVDLSARMSRRARALRATVEGDDVRLVAVG
jgi:tRNA G10  N-methylase Trm11